MLKRKPAGASNPSIINKKNTLKSIWLLVAEFPISALDFTNLLKRPKPNTHAGLLYLWEYYGFYYLGISLNERKAKIIKF